ncbi:MAG: HAD family phosphatase [Microbacterium sp.]|nr:HAD family phosphatase [Microbacterium sp.]
MIAPSLSAVLWDMDGTIVDTEPLWMAAETALVGSFGGRWDHEQALQLVGMGLDTSARILQDAGVRMSEGAIIDHLTDAVMAQLGEGNVVFRPGARELLAANRAAGLRNALVTMSHRRMALVVAGLLPDETFELVVGGDEVARPKPFPDPYLQAAEALGISPDQAVVIEDSPGGTRSGVAAGIATIGVPHMVPLEGLGATVLWPTLADRTPDDLRGVHERFTR